MLFAKHLWADCEFFLPYFCIFCMYLHAETAFCKWQIDAFVTHAGRILSLMFQVRGFSSTLVKVVKKDKKPLRKKSLRQQTYYLTTHS